MFPSFPSAYLLFFSANFGWKRTIVGPIFPVQDCDARCAVFEAFSKRYSVPVPVLPTKILDYLSTTIAHLEAFPVTHARDAFQVNPLFRVPFQDVLGHSRDAFQVNPRSVSLSKTFSAIPQWPTRSRVTFQACCGCSWPVLDASCLFQGVPKTFTVRFQYF